MPKVTAMGGFGRTTVFSIVLGMGIELLTPPAMLGFAFVILAGDDLHRCRDSTLGALILFYKPILRLRTADDIVPDRVPAAAEPRNENS